MKQIHSQIIYSSYQLPSILGKNNNIKDSAWSSLHHVDVGLFAFLFFFSSHYERVDANVSDVFVVIMSTYSRHPSRCVHERVYQTLNNKLINFNFDCKFYIIHSSALLSFQHRNTQETLTVLDRLDLDTDKPSEEEIARKFGFEEAYAKGDVSWWQNMKPQIWSLFDEPYSSNAAKVGKLEHISPLFFYLTTAINH